ncbi:hypothetical protein BDV93DRAFT_515406 [Ceratobasidium sp. AG-I]|nr:hypothetical protein BDV93DRAFT_515406 [Ceratobasidium sp. AG-I]
MHTNQSLSILLHVHISHNSLKYFTTTSSKSPDPSLVIYLTLILHNNLKQNLVSPVSWIDQQQEKTHKKKTSHRTAINLQQMLVPMLQYHPALGAMFSLATPNTQVGHLTTACHTDTTAMPPRKNTTATKSTQGSNLAGSSTAAVKVTTRRVPASQLPEAKQVEEQRNQAKLKVEAPLTDEQMNTFMEQLTKARQSLAGYLKCPLWGHVMELCLFAFGHPNPRLRDALTINDLRDNMIDNGVLDALNPMDAMIDLSELTEECKKTLNLCKDPLLWKGPPPILEFKWQHDPKFKELMAKITKANWSVDWDAGRALTPTEAENLGKECLSLVKSLGLPLIHILAGSHRSGATVKIAEEYRRKIRTAFEAKDYPRAQSLTVECKHKCTFWVAVFNKETLAPDSTTWLAANRKVIFRNTQPAESAFMCVQSMTQIMAYQMTQAGATEREAFTHAFDTLNKSGYISRKDRGSYLLQMVGHRLNLALLRTLCGFPTVVQRKTLSSNLAEHMRTKDNGGLLCALALMSGMKLREMTHVVEDLLDPTSPAWFKCLEDFKDLPPQEELSSKGSVLYDQFLESIMCTPPADLGSTNLSACIQEPFLMHYDLLYKKHHPTMTTQKGDTTFAKAPWEAIWDDAKNIAGRKLLLALAKVMDSEFKPDKESSRETVRASIKKKANLPHLQVNMNHMITVLQIVLHAYSGATLKVLRTDIMFPSSRFFSTLNTWGKSDEAFIQGLFCYGLANSPWYHQELYIKSQSNTFEGKTHFSTNSFS